jgi:hypothetical protein
MIFGTLPGLSPTHSLVHRRSLRVYQAQSPIGSLCHGHCKLHRRGLPRPKENERLTIPYNHHAAHRRQPSPWGCFHWSGQALRSCSLCTGRRSPPWCSRHGSTANRACQFHLRILPLLFGMPTWENVIKDRNTCRLEAVSLSSITAADCTAALLSGWIRRLGAAGGNHQRQRGPQFTSALWSALG